MTAWRSSPVVMSLPSDHKRDLDALVAHLLEAELEP